MKFRPGRPPEILPRHCVRANWESLQGVLEKLPAAAYLCDADGLITYFNDLAAQVWGRAPQLNDPADRFCGSSKLFSTDGKPIAHDQCWMALALKTGQEYNGQEIVIECPDGSRRIGLGACPSNLRRRRRLAGRRQHRG